MHRVRTFCVAVGLTAVLSTAARTSMVLAQNPRPANSNSNSKDEPESLAGLMRGIGSGPQTPVTVLMAPAVQHELKLTDDQKNKVYRLSLTASQKQRDQFQSELFAGDVDPRAMRAARDEMRSQNEQSIARILDDTQRGRFNQIVLQAEGPISVARPDVAAKLKLNDTQKEYVQSIIGEMQRSQFVLFMRIRQGVAAGQVNPGQLSQVREMMSRLRDEAGRQIGKVIDRKQKDAFNAMLGKPFDLSKLDDGAGEGAGAEAGATGTAGAKDAPKGEADAGPDPAPDKKKPARGKGTSTPRKKARTRTAKPAP